MDIEDKSVSQSSNVYRDEWLAMGKYKTEVIGYWLLHFLLLVPLYVLYVTGHTARTAGRSDFDRTLV